MKYLSTFVLIFFISWPAFSEDTASEDAPDKQPADQQSTTNSKEPIGERYIRDYIYVPLRSGQSEAYRIVHRGLRTGTRVLLLEENPDTDYSKVRLSNGLEGWIGSQYLQKEPTAAMKLEEAQKTIKRLSQSAGSAGQELLDLEKNNRKLKSELEQLQEKYQHQASELERITSLSGKAIELDEENNDLMKSNERLKSSQDTLKAENARLASELKRDDFLNGAIAVILGIIATVVVQYFYRSRKRSDWA